MWALPEAGAARKRSEGEAGKPDIHPAPTMADSADGRQLSPSSLARLVQYITQKTLIKKVCLFIISRFVPST